MSIKEESCSYYQDVIRYRLDEAKQNELILSYKEKGNVHDREAFLSAQLAWAASLMRTTFGFCPCLLDLIQDSGLDMEDLIESYDPAAGASFRTYCRPILLHRAWVRASYYKDGMAASDSSRKRAIYLHCYYQKQVEAGAGEAEAHHATVLEYCRQYSRHNYDQMPEKKRRKIEEKVTNLMLLGGMGLSLDMPMVEGDEDSDTLGTVLPDESFSPEQLAVDDELIEVLHRAVEALTPRQRFVVVHRVGMYGEERMSFKQISACLSVSRQRVNTVFNEAKGKLQAALAPYYAG